MDPQTISEALGNIMAVAGIGAACAIREYTPIIARRLREIVKRQPASHDSMARRRRVANRHVYSN